MGNYRMTFDLHTHTRFVHRGKEIKHAVGTVEENVRVAREKGLKAIGISNHGPGHLTYGFSQEDIPELMEEIRRMRARYPEIKIFLGVEANIINVSGKLDVLPGQTGAYDYIMAGYHYGIFGERPISAAFLHGMNWLYDKTSIFPTLRRGNTQRVVKALQVSKPRILTHPGDKGNFDIDAIATVCAQSGVWMEINNFHNALSVDGIKRAARYDVKFVIGSDAHSPEGVGCFEEALYRAEEAGLELWRIVNIERKDKQLSGAEE